ARPHRRGDGAPRARRRHGDRELRPLHELQRRALLLAPPRRRADWPPGRTHLDGVGTRGLRRRSRGATRFMMEPVTDLDPGRISEKLAKVREHAGPEGEILAATKYVRPEDMGPLAEAGIELVGENRLQDLEAKQERWRESFTWDYIGTLQSRKVKPILPLVRLIHSVASDSVLDQLGKHGEDGAEVLV